MQGDRTNGYLSHPFLTSRPGRVVYEPGPPRPCHMHLYGVPTTAKRPGAVPPLLTWGNYLFFIARWRIRSLASDLLLRLVRLGWLGDPLEIVYSLSESTI